MCPELNATASQWEIIANGNFEAALVRAPGTMHGAARATDRCSDDACVRVHVLPLRSVLRRRLTDLVHRERLERRDQVEPVDVQLPDDVLHLFFV